MSDPVDVRQWLGDERFMYGPRTESRAKCEEAYAAVAELIEADKEYDTARSRYDHAFCDGPRGDLHEQRLAQKMLREAKERRAAALARIQGGA